MSMLGIEPTPYFQSEEECGRNRQKAGKGATNVLKRNPDGYSFVQFGTGKLVKIVKS